MWLLPNDTLRYEVGILMPEVFGTTPPFSLNVPAYDAELAKGGVAGVWVHVVADVFHARQFSVWALQRRQQLGLCTLIKIHPRLGVPEGWVAQV